MKAGTAGSSRLAGRGNSGAEAQGRTGDTGIFSAVLYQLSYLSIDLSS